ncbi:hypothetical protein EDC94DRAFT_513167, partial [Helicostylum pulchrum]
FFESEITRKDHVTDDLLQICDQVHTQFYKALEALEQDVADPNLCKRTCLVDGASYVTTCSKKYQLDPPVSQPKKSTSNTTVQNILPPLPEVNANWLYIEDYRTKHGENSTYWEECYSEGYLLIIFLDKLNFLNYNNRRSLKSGYYRFSKKEN